MPRSIRVPKHIHQGLYASRSIASHFYSIRRCCSSRRITSWSTSYRLYSFRSYNLRLCMSPVQQPSGGKQIALGIPYRYTGNDLSLASAIPRNRAGRVVNNSIVDSNIKTPYDLLLLSPLALVL